VFWIHGPLFLILLLAFAIYFPGLNGPLILDDLTHLKPMLLIDDGEVSWYEFMQESGLGWRDRPISILSFALNFSFMGADVWFLKIVNLLLHLACGVLIYSICHFLLSQPEINIQSQAKKWLVLWIAAAWILAPIQVSTTLYVIQRMAQLSTFFMLFGLLTYIVGRQRVNKTEVKGFIFIALTFILFLPLAVFSKENGVLLPLLVFVIEYFFFYKINNKTKLDSIIFHSLLLMLVLFFVLFLIICISDPDSFFGVYQYRDFNLYERVLTQSRIIIDYMLNILMIPGGSGMGLFHDDFQKSIGLLSPYTTLLSIIFLISLIVISVLNAGKKAGFVLFGLVFFMAAHSLESSVFPLELYFEHRNYLPSFGIFFSVGSASYYLLESVRIKKVIVIAMIFMLTSFSVFTLYRVDIWQSWSSILLASQAQHPDSLRVQRGLVVVYTQRGELQKALRHLSEVDRLDNKRGDTGIAMKYLLAYCYAGQYPVEEVYQRLDKTKPIPYDNYTGTVFMWMVESIEESECKTFDANRLLEIFNQRVTYHDENIIYNNWVQIVLLARLYATQANWKQASKLIDKAIELKPDVRKNYVEKLKHYYDSMQQPDSF
jgi:protein O-mannosyl-transferase